MIPRNYAKPALSANVRINLLFQSIVIHSSAICDFPHRFRRFGKTSTQKNDVNYRIASHFGTKLSSCFAFGTNSHVGNCFIAYIIANTKVEKRSTERLVV